MVDRTVCLGVINCLALSLFPFKCKTFLKRNLHIPLFFKAGLQGWKQKDGQKSKMAKLYRDGGTELFVHLLCYDIAGFHLRGGHRGSFPP